MVVQCEQVWREVSNYLEGDLNPELRLAIEQHVRGCSRCTAVLDGTRNVVHLYGDERMFDVPLGFSYRLRHRLEETTSSRKRTALGWVVAFAVAALLLASFEVARSSSWGWPQLRNRLAQSTTSIPPNMMVVAADDGKVFHVPGCRYIHDKAHVRTLTAGEALKEGYTPCVRCMKQYLSAAALAGFADAETASAAVRASEKE